MTVTSGEGDSVILAEDVPAGHKVALVNIPKGDAVVKFGVNIGTAVAAIGAGAHVHVHNLESERMRGDRD
jgi:altronate dehydratase